MKRFVWVLGLMGLTVAAIVGCSKDDNNVIGTNLSYNQVDRMAVPALNTALIPAAQKEAFNRASPVGDVVTFRSAVVNSITALRTNVSTRGLGPETGSLTPDQLADIIIPDVVTVDFSQALSFPNGRDLNDDVIDTVLSLVLNRTVSDGVASDNTIRATFPYLGTPNPLPAPGL